MIIRDVTNKIKKIFPFIAFIIFFFSINAEPWKIDVFQSKSTFVDYLNYFRGIFPVVIGFFILFNIIIKKKKIYNPDIITFFFLTYFFIQLCGFLINFPISSEDNFSYRIYFLSLLFFSVLLFSTIEKNYLNKILILMIILILLINLYFVSVSAYEFFLKNKKPFYYLKIFQIETTVFNSPSIRSTGLARINLILFLFGLIILEKFKNIYSVSFIVVNLFIILLLQSRVNIYSAFFFLIFFLIFFKNFKIKERIKLFAIFVFTPLLIYHSIKFEDHKKTAELTISNNLQKNIIFNKEKHNTIDNYTTGRITIWKTLLNKEKDFKQITFGFGTQADRMLTSPSFFSASNAYVYIFICSGIFGLIIIISFILYINKKIYKLLFEYNIFSKNNNIFLKISILLFVYFLIRSLVESSFAVYGIDYLLFIVSSKIILLTHQRQILK
jgi:hypothetical protein